MRKETKRSPRGKEINCTLKKGSLTEPMGVLLWRGSTRGQANAGRKQKGAERENPNERVGNKGGGTFTDSLHARVTCGGES